MLAPAGGLPAVGGRAAARLEEAERGSLCLEADARCPVRPLLQPDWLRRDAHHSHLGKHMQHLRRCVTASPHPVQGDDRPAERAAARLERAETDRVARKVYWGLLPLLTGMGVFIYLDRSNLSFISSQIIPALGLTNTDYGLGSGAPYPAAIPYPAIPYPVMNTLS